MKMRSLICHLEMLSECSSNEASMVVDSQKCELKIGPYNFLTKKSIDSFCLVKLPTATCCKHALNADCLSRLASGSFNMILCSEDPGSVSDWCFKIQNSGPPFRFSRYSTPRHSACICTFNCMQKCFQCYQSRQLFCVVETSHPLSTKLCVSMFGEFEVGTLPWKLSPPSCTLA